MSDTVVTSSNFIRHIVSEDLQNGRVNHVLTRFPPEPNGYLHIGHAKSICLNFELADEFGGKTNLRFDDTNPVKEDTEYVESIQEDVRWLGFQWDDLFYASDFFGKMYDCAELLIRKGLAFVCELTAEETRQYRGSLTEGGKESPYRSRSIEENLDLFARMRAGEFPDGSKVLRAKIDMSSPNMNLRDPVIYRISHTEHHNTGNAWCIYPMYDFAHPLCDAFEGISHSICTLEFEDHRPLYDWVVEACEMPHVPRQYEFARLNMTETVMSKRKLKLLVDEAIVDGWDDPRMPTISGLRRRGFTPDAIRQFCREIGVARAFSTVDAKMLDHFIREDLKLKAPRTMGVLHPLKVVITNYPQGQVEWLDAEINPENPDMGIRQIPFSREIYIEQDDFMEVPPPKYHRLFPGNEVRLKHAYFIKCEEIIKDADGNVIELRATYDPATKSGSGFTERKVKGTIHWVEASHAAPAEFRLYEPLVREAASSSSEAAPSTSDIGEKAFAKAINNGVREGDASFLKELNPSSLLVLNGFVEADVKHAEIQTKYQFFRHGYFNVDSKYTTEERLVLNLIVELKSSFKV